LAAEVRQWLAERSPSRQIPGCVSFRNLRLLASADLSMIWRPGSGRIVVPFKDEGRAVNISLQELADLVQGKVLGDPQLLIRGAKTLQEAAEGDITFLEHQKKLNLLHESKASAAVVGPTIPANGKALIQAADPLAAFIAIVQHLQGKPAEKPTGIDPRAAVHGSVRIGAEPTIMAFAVVGEGTEIGDRCRIHAGAVIGRGCKIGHNVEIHPNAVLYDGVEIGDRSVVHANAVVGSDGFGYRFQNGRHVKVPQLGTVSVGADVEIGACTTIDRGAFQATRIGDGTKIDNLVQVGHNCQIGKHNIFVSQMGIAGSSSTDDYVVIAGQVGIADHIHIGAGTTIGAKAGVTKDVPAGQRMLGAPATPEREQKRILISLERLPEIRRDVRKIKQHLGIADDDS
jgi:UDP-3-O-[3-hydroxymyristoyl] glucosamine N-acyltransferase